MWFIHHINKLKDENHMIISVDAGKEFDKIQLPFRINTFQEVGIEGTYFNIIKTIYDNPRVDTIFSCEKLKAFPLRSGIRQGCLFSSLVFIIIIQYSFGSPSHANQRGKKEIKWIQIGKEVKLLLFANDMILYTENHKNATKKLLQLINEFSIVTGYRINTQSCIPI